MAAQLAAPPRLAYVCARPLVFAKRDGSVAAVPEIDADAELALLKDALRDANRAVRFVADRATAQSIRRLVTLGCDAVSYTHLTLPTKA